MTVVGSQPVAEATSRWTLGTTVAAAAAVPGVSPGSPPATPRPRGGPASPGPEGAEEDTSSDCPPLDDNGGARGEDDVVRSDVDAAGHFVDDVDDDHDDVGAGVDDNSGNDDVRDDADREGDDIGDDDDGDGGGGRWSTADATCNISLTPGPTGLQARWSGTGFLPCDLHIFSTNPGRASSFSTSFTRVRSPLLLERHLGEDDGHGYRACVSCAPTASLGLRAPRARPFCCRDMSRAEVYLCPGCGGEGPRVREGGRGPLEAAVVACFMTAVLTVWVVAALVWPVPIVAEFLPSLLTEPRGRRVAARR
ncbi:transmembrane protein 158 [Lampetra fluviatilis]